ncbi:MAG TPA: DEAD/DEAH box helicase [Verrucomicrobiota bacterium]|mgnify:CR=1 FL=1|nr:DEAD/DEAH box helicase [Verrucomicrobiota bacterium]HQL80427.1 DEAD/DEAH box helicase [Verrucomicrobiota bacterium]
MARVLPKKGNGSRPAQASKYDAQNTVLTKTYGALADLRRELGESSAVVAEREELLWNFAGCADSQRAWLLLEDYFEKLSLSRKDFPSVDWWPRLLAAQGPGRLEELAFLFLRAQRPVPTELGAYANLDRFAQVEHAAQEQQLVRHLEAWLFPEQPAHFDSPRAFVRAICHPQPDPEQPACCRLAVELHLVRPRAGEKVRKLSEVVELTTRAAQEQELFPPGDWEFIRWLAETHPNRRNGEDRLVLSDLELLHWLARWGHTARLELADGKEPPQTLEFSGAVAELTPHLENGAQGLSFTHRLTVPGGATHPLSEVRFFSRHPTLALVGRTFYLLRNAPPPPVFELWANQPAVPMGKLSHRLLMHLRKAQSNHGVDWEQLCITHAAKPQFLFELLAETVRLRLLARSQRDQSLWIWNGHEWKLHASNPPRPAGTKPEILDDARLEPATQWLRRLDWFTPEPGLWVGDATEGFLGLLARAWADRPAEAEYLGNPGFSRLFLAPRQLRPRLVVKGSGIDWLEVSAEWEQEGLKLTAADLQRLQTATGRFVKLPDSGWVELDSSAVQSAHEAIADLGVDGLIPVAQRIGLEQAAHWDEEGLQRFGDSAQARALRERLKNFEGLPAVALPASVRAEMRPYQKEGFDFLCHLTRLRLGGILADDMGLGKTLQTLAWLAWLKDQHRKDPQPALVICPASVLHNWRREAERFTPQLKVLVLESGAARHNLRKQVPQYDLIVTNYALLRRDLEELQKFAFRAIVLDEAQFIKNPEAQVTQSVKQLKAELRLALTGTPLENRLLDLWSIVDFIQPGYLGNRDHFTETYEPRGEDAEGAQRIARRRLSAKLRPLLLRRLKKHVAKDLPERIEQRRDCQLGDEQRKLYLAELRRSREQVMKAVAEKGLNKSKLHVLAALTRLRQVCCHPKLVGNDTASGKTETLFELLDPLIAEGQKVLLFSQFVQMLQLLEAECRQRQIPTHILTGQTKDRQAVVGAFQDDPNPAVFLLSLRAAGTGLNLTTASYVVLYDPWWNPAVEAQAIDRSHRIGQTRTVNAYRLISPGTVEEKIWELQQSKAQTIADVLGEEGFARSLSKTDLEYLFAED